MSSHARTMETKSTPDRFTDPLPIRRPTSDTPTNDTKVEPPVAGTSPGVPRQMSPNVGRLWKLVLVRGATTEFS